MSMRLHCIRKAKVMTNVIPFDQALGISRALINAQSPQLDRPAIRWISVKSMEGTYLMYLDQQYCRNLQSVIVGDHRWKL